MRKTIITTECQWVYNLSRGLESACIHLSLDKAMGSFWVVWSPTSKQPPAVKFSSSWQARLVSDKMSEKFGGLFYILKGYENGQGLW